MIEAIKQALEALESYHGYMEPLTTVFGGPRVPAEQSTTGKVEKAITSLRQAIAELESQEPKCVVIVEVFGKDWRLEYMSLPVGKHKLYAQQYLYTHPPQRTEQNFCPRCGKRTNDIHTCTPPEENT